MSRPNTQKSIVCLSIINRKENFLDIYDHIEKPQTSKDKSDIDVQDLYIENYKTLWTPKGMERYTYSWSKDSKCVFGNPKVIFPNVSRDSMQSKPKSQQVLFVCGNYQTNFKIYIKIQQPRISRVILKKNKVEKLSLLNNKPYC